MNYNLPLQNIFETSINDMARQMMITIKYIFILICLSWVNTVIAAEKPMDNIDQMSLLKAIEDYRFSDFETSIKNLELLHQKFPENKKVLRYLALSYQENENHEQATQTFNLWLKASDQLLNEETRFAWLGLATSYAQLKNYPASIANLRSWLKVYPDDLQTRSLLAKTLVQANELETANETWDLILGNKSIQPSLKAEALYYKAWIAYQNQNSEQAKSFADQSLAADNQGNYAQASQNLISAITGSTGSYALGAMEIFYHSNVALLPDILESQEKASDNGFQTNMSAGWRSSEYDIIYAYSNTKYSTQTDFNSTSHSLSAAWLRNAWRITPSYEKVTLGDDNLYAGTGVAVYYTHLKKTYHYTIKRKAFNDSYGTSAVDLSRLGGMSHSIGLDMPLNIQEQPVTFSTYITRETTNGDLTHEQTDNYLQLGIGLATAMALETDINMYINLQLYKRNYANSDTSILVTPADETKRSDLFTQLSANTQWKPWGNKLAAVNLNLSYTKNSSNYDEGTVNDLAIKSYSGWKAGLQLSKQW